MKWFLVALSVALGGCPADDATTPDGGDGPGDQGLVVAWLSRPDLIPGPVDNELTLDRVTLHLRNARAIGDAGVGDPRTLAPLVELIWATSAVPPDLAFPEAPTGLYARMSFELDRGGGTDAYELTGTAEIRAVTEPFTVRDRDPLPVSFEYQIALPPGAAARIPVRIDLDSVVRALDFEAAPIVGGRRVIETGDPQMPVLRTELAKAFGVHSSDL